MAVKLTKIINIDFAGEDACKNTKQLQRKQEVGDVRILKCHK